MRGGHASEFAHDGEFWRSLAALGARRFPRWWMRYSPPVFGLAAAALVPSARRAVRANLERIRGPVPLWRDTLDTALTFTTYANCLSEGLARGSKNDGDLRATWAGAEYMQAAIGRGRGVIVLSMHTAGWEITTPLWFQDTNVEVMVVMEKERSARAQAIQDRPRSAPGTRFVHIGDDPLSALPIVRHLESRGAVGMQIDRPPSGGRSVCVRLFDRPYEIPEGPLRIAQLTGAALLPSYTARHGFQRYFGQLYPALTLPRRASRAEVEEVAQGIAKTMEDFLRRYPTQWFRFGG